MSAAEERQKKDPKGHKSHQSTKLLAAIVKIAFQQIPQDPTSARYRQGTTLGEELKHWFREKFGNGRFRLFFRYDSKSKIIIYAWVNDEQTLRTRGSSSDAYAVFQKMVEGGNPPNDWTTLKKACSDPKAIERLAKERRRSRECR